VNVNGYNIQYSNLTNEKSIKCYNNTAHKYIVKNGNSLGDNNNLYKNHLFLPTGFANLKMKKLSFTKIIYLRILLFRFGFVRDNYVGHFAKTNFKDKT